MNAVLRHLRGAWTARLFWAAVIALHGPALVGTTRALLAEPGAGTLATWLALAATVGFFTLKALDVPWLRLGSRRRFALIFVIACAFVHHEAAASAADEAEAVTAAVVVTAVALGAVRLLPALSASLRVGGLLGLRPCRITLRLAAPARPRTPLALRRAARAPPLVA